MSSSRRKSCKECSKAKRRCDLRSPCRRCTERLLSCIYAQAPPAFEDQVGAMNVSTSDFAATADPVAFLLQSNPAPHALDEAQFVIDSQDTAFLDLQFDEWLPDNSNNMPDLSMTRKRRIEELLPTGREIGRADGLPTPVEDLARIGEHFDRETLSDPNSRLSVSIAAIKGFHREFAETCQTPWLHQRLYKTKMLDYIHGVFVDCVLYSNKTAANQDLVYRSIELNTERLLQLSRPEAVEGHLARVQALLLYQSMRLFDPDVCQRYLAEASLSTLEHWTDLLADQRDASAELSNMSHQKPITWESWVRAESIRRTVLTSYSLVSFYRVLRREHVQPRGCTDVQPWTICRHLWEAPTSFDFFEAWQQKPRFCIQSLSLDDFLKSGKGSDVDDFARLMLVTYMGLDETRQWFKDTGSIY